MSEEEAEQIHKLSLTQENNPKSNKIRKTGIIEALAQRQVDNRETEKTKNILFESVLRSIEPRQKMNNAKEKEITSETKSNCFQKQQKSKSEKQIDHIKQTFEQLSHEKKYELELEYKTNVMTAMNDLLEKQKYAKSSETKNLLKKKMREMVQADFLYHCTQIQSKTIRLVRKFQEIVRKRIMMKVLAKIEIKNLELANIKRDIFIRKTELVGNPNYNISRQTNFIKV